MKRRMCFFVVATVGLAMACGGEDQADVDALEGRELAQTTQELIAVPCNDVSGTITEQSLVVTDATALKPFTMAAVLNAIRTTANVAAVSTNAAQPIYQRWMKTFGSTANAGDCNDPNIDPNDYGLACPRSSELKLASVSLSNFEPVALVNRFDLTPGSGANCGEYRIVFALRGPTAPQGRGFIIFEAALPNPNPAQGVDACLPVARFWQGLSTDASAASRALKLSNFYFKGTAVAGFPAVVKAAHYGLSTNSGTHTAGQVRTNFFIDFNEWHLREFKLKRTCGDAANPATCALDFAHVTSKVNPAEELFAGTHPRSAAFRTQFVTQVPALAGKSAALIRMNNSDAFNEFESVSQAGNVLYRNTANAAMRSAIQSKLTEIGSTLTVNNILDRATTQTCAGCHQVSQGSLGGGVRWLSPGFVHIDEAGQMSQQLATVFVPRRKAVLESFINARCTGAKPVIDPVIEMGMTVGGAPEGAPN